MAENMSLADQAVQALSMVKAMDANVDNDTPHRHMVRSLKRIAEQKISAALREAIDLAWLAQDLPHLAEAMRKQVLKDAAGKQPAEVERASQHP